MLKKVGDFLYRNRGKLIAMTVVTLGATAYYTYSQSSTPSDENDGSAGVDGKGDECSSGTSTGNNTSVSGSGGGETSVTASSKESKGDSSSNCSNISRSSNTISLTERTKWRLKARKQFDSIICTFLGILVVKINEVIDTSAIVAEIKLLKSAINEKKASVNSEEEDDEEEESEEDDSSEELLQIEKLWDRLKVSSLSILMVNAFMVSTLSVLIQVQAYIISKYLYLLSLTPGGSEEGLGDDAVKILMECTYGHMLKSGLETAINIITQHIASCFSEWTISNKLEVEFSHLRQNILSVKKTLEENLDGFLKVIIINKYAPPEIAENGNPKMVLIRKIINQTWDIIDSPMFAASVKEAVDNYFAIFFDQLKRSTFMKDPKSESPVKNLKKPPLAALLTRIQSTSTNMIPIDIGGGGATAAQNQSNMLILKDIMSGPILDSLCISVFDASTLSD